MRFEFAFALGVIDDGELLDVWTAILREEVRQHLATVESPEGTNRDGEDDSISRGDAAQEAHEWQQATTPTR